MEFLRLDYPEAGFRPVPKFALALPENWVVSEYPDALFAAGSSDGSDGAEVDEHWTNLIVHHERVLPGADLEAWANTRWELLSTEIEGTELHEVALFEANGIAFALTEMTLPAGGEDAIAVDTKRFDAFLLGPDREHPTWDLFHVTAVQPAAAGDDGKALVYSILNSLRFT